MTGRAPGAVRAFVALDVPPAVRERLSDVARELEERLPAFRPVAEDNIHLTLRFLGTTSPDAVTRLTASLGPIAGQCAPAEAAVTELGTFPARGRVRVLWAGLDLPPRFTELHLACEQLARHEGFAPEERAFAPHLTIGRWREPALRPELPPLAPMACRVEHLVLWRSDLFARGPQYTALARFPLGAAS
jgi:2'-5' RNA ligase